MLVAMAGLPGTGKSSLAVLLEQELGAVILNKDAVRSVLFPSRVLDYSGKQDDICIRAIFDAAASILSSFPKMTVILDGRTFVRAGQIQDLLNFATALQVSPRIVECVCADAVARARLERDLELGEHPAGNRTFGLYRALKAEAKPIPIPHLILDTGQTSLEKCVARCLEYFGTPDDAAAPQSDCGNDKNQ
jgi:predicted kinase